MEFKEILEAVLEWLKESGVRILLIIVLAMIVIRIGRVIVNRIFRQISKDASDGEMKKRADTLSSIIRYVLNISILVIMLIMILGEFGIAIGPILAAAGIVGLAVGFGAQNLVQDVISGFFILLEDQIRVGDVVQISGKAGLVEKVNLRMTILRDLSGNVHFVRNGRIDAVTNMTKNFSYYVFDIGVAYRENVDEVIEIIKGVGKDLQKNPDYGKDILEELEVLGLDKFGDSAVIIKARIKTKPITQWKVGREFNRMLKKKFDEMNIEIPFPHVTMYIGKDKEGQSPPLNVALKDNQGQTSPAD